MQSGGVSIDARSKIKKNSGHKKRIAEVPLHLRSTLRSMSAAVKEPLASVFRVFKEGRLTRVSNTLKPRLTEENKLRRIEFALSFVDRNTL
jgi:hypothetical protein